MENTNIEDKNLIANSILFDADWYCQRYGFGKYLDAANHYLNIGWKENKNPSPYFSTADYLAKNPDVAEANLNPLLHFEKYGFKEGRYCAEIEKIMPKVLERHPECRANLDGGLLRIRITNNCNAKCRYCGVRLGFGEEFFHAMEPSWYYELCKPLYDKISIVLITGGDAFFAKESYNYMKFMSENFPKITLMTESNGIAFNEKFQNLACENLFKAHFSINASNAEVFAKSCWDSDDSQTAKKMFPLIIKNIKSYLAKLIAENKLCFAPDLSMVINKDNADDIVNFTELALELHAGFIVFFFDYTENDMSGEYFSHTETSRPALKTLMELERVLAKKILIYFRLWIPTKEVINLQQEVESIPLSELQEKYKKILELAKDRNILAEFEERNKIRREVGKFELDLVHDFSPTLHLRTDVDKQICSAPWNEIDISPDGRMDCCCWFEPTKNFNEFIQTDSEGKNFVDWERTLNSFEYASIRYRILQKDFRGCAVGCPMNSVKNPIEPVTKYNLDRTKITPYVKKVCACCGEEIDAYSPIPAEFVELIKKYNVPVGEPYEMLSLEESICPNCGSWDRERAYALVMKKILPQNKKFKMLDIAPRKCITDFIKNNFPQAEYKTGDLLMPDVDYKLDITDMKEIADGEFDFFICSHVLEHVTDDLKAMRELKRILSADGKGIIVVPINLNRKEIDEDPSVTDVAERWRRFGQDDHVRAYSKQGFIDRLKQVGFKVTEYNKNFFGEDLMAENGLCETSTVYIVSQ